MHKIIKVEGVQIPKGSVKVSGAKNSATKLLAASLISEKITTISNYPTELVDVKEKIRFIKDSGGCIFTDSEEDTIEINPLNFQYTKLSSYDYKFRSTYLLVPGLLKKSKIARIPYPGGCKIGNRGYDVHVMIWKRMGAIVMEKSDYIEVKLNSELKGTTIKLPISTVGGTENAIICGCIAKGKTVINNAYITPEVLDLISFLISMGAEINVVGNSYIEIFGKSDFESTFYSVMPDRIEALTWLVFGAISAGNIIIKDVPFNNMKIPLDHIKESGLDFFRNFKNIMLNKFCYPANSILSFEIATGSHPGIISDMQPFYTLLGLHANGSSRIYDYRYPERIAYCNELKKIYKKQINSEIGLIKVDGKNNFNSVNNVNLNCTDLRGGMAVLIAAFLNDGVSQINDFDMILRGYNKLQFKLNSLGLKFENLNF